MSNTDINNVASAFNKFSDRIISEVTFIHDYFQINMQEYGLSFLSETFIKTDEGEFQIPSKDGNWYLYQLIGKAVIGIEETENNIIVNFENGWTITVDTCLEPPGDNFNMGGPGLIPIFI